MLIDHSEVPKLLRRSHIHSGYRPLNKSLRYYVASAFRLHNELVNFWTHMLPFFFIYFYFLHPEIFFEAELRWPLVVLYSGISVLFVASSFTHLMHSRSQNDHVFWLLVDFSGIFVFSLCVGIQRISMKESSSFFSTDYWTTSGFFVIAPFWKTRDVIRLITCLSVAAVLYVPLLDRYFSSSTDLDPGLSLHSSAFMWLLISGIFMGANIPECFAPGRFDYFCYGHQLFHLCIFMVTWNVCEAARLDADSVNPELLSTKIDLFPTVMKILFLNVLGIVGTISVLFKIAKGKNEEQK
ncbi:hypothetical protein FO519_004468 [Halicephalobus sp. NKZ332]|nr:hypothetical protein FO519_004468 [Halicephalobus sp. NKZ332]